MSKDPTVPARAQFSLQLALLLRRMITHRPTPLRALWQAASPARRAPQQAHVALVGVGPGAKDLLTLRARDRIAAADVVLYDRLVEPEVLTLAPQSARRIYVGKAVGAHAWPQPRIDAKIIEEARKGLRVVRLKSGDPSIFGRVTEELTACTTAGIEVEVIPGVTAACAAAAHMQLSLTERGVSDTLILTTGTCRDGDPLPESALHARPGTNTVFYMSVRQSARIRDGLIARGVPEGARVQIAADVAKPGERLLSCALRDLPETLATSGIKGCAILMLTWPKDQTAGRSGSCTATSAPFSEATLQATLPASHPAIPA